VRGRGRLLVAGASLALLAACGSSATAPDPGQLLKDAKQSIDSAPTVHFTLTSQGVTGTGTLITGGQGDASRPNSFAGTLSVVAGGFPVTVKIVSTGGVFYAQTPLSSSYDKTDPSAYGFGDPAQLLDPSHGLSSLLTACTGAASQTADLLSGEQLDEVGCSIPGTLVAKLLTSADSSQAVQATVGVDATTHQLRRVALVGLFFEKMHNSTFTVVLDKYGENVTITPPAG
jgi:lipoprotein LprG